MAFTPDRSKIAYSIKEACQATSLGRTTLYKLISEGKLGTIKVGTRTLIPADSLESFLAQKP
jgi:excisionase family DNA binding protein